MACSCYIIELFEKKKKKTKNKKASLNDFVTFDCFGCSSWRPDEKLQTVGRLPNPKTLKIYSKPLSSLSSLRHSLMTFSLSLSPASTWLSELWDLARINRQRSPLLDGWLSSLRVKSCSSLHSSPCCQTCLFPSDLFYSHTPCHLNSTAVSKHEELCSTELQLSLNKRRFYHFSCNLLDEYIKKATCICTLGHEY